MTFNPTGITDMVKKKKIAGARNEAPIKEDLKKFKEEIVKLPGHPVRTRLARWGFPAM